MAEINDYISSSHAPGTYSSVSTIDPNNFDTSNMNEGAWNYLCDAYNVGGEKLPGSITYVEGNNPNSKSDDFYIFSNEYQQGQLGEILEVRANVLDSGYSDSIKVHCAFGGDPGGNPLGTKYSSLYNTSSPETRPDILGISFRIKINLDPGGQTAGVENNNIVAHATGLITNGEYTFSDFLAESFSGSGGILTNSMIENITKLRASSPNANISMLYLDAFFGGSTVGDHRFDKIYSDYTALKEAGVSLIYFGNEQSEGVGGYAYQNTFTELSKALGYGVLIDSGDINNHPGKYKAEVEAGIGSLILGLTDSLLNGYDFKIRFWDGEDFTGDYTIDDLIKYINETSLSAKYGSMFNSVDTSIVRSSWEDVSSIMYAIKTCCQRYEKIDSAEVTSALGGYNDPTGLSSQINGYITTYNNLSTLLFSSLESLVTFAESVANDYLGLDQNASNEAEQLRG